MDTGEKETLGQMLRDAQWFTAGRYSTVDDAETAFLAAFRTPRTEAYRRVDAAELGKETERSIIDRFLKCDQLRVVAESDDDGQCLTDVRTEAEIRADDDIASEALAEIYLAQGMSGKAIETYERLCLLFPEKNVYFAGRIERIKQEKKQ